MSAPSSRFSLPGLRAAARLDPKDSTNRSIMICPHDLYHLLRNSFHVLFFVVLSPAQRSEAGLSTTRGRERLRTPVPQCTVRTLLVVLLPPALQQRTRLQQRRELLALQHLIPQPRMVR